MSFHVIRKNGLEYLQSDILPEDVVHGFSTRHGGVSEGYLSSLNLGIHRGDRPGNVLQNYRLWGEAVGFRPQDTVFTRQVHGVHVARVGRRDRGCGLFLPVTKARDGLITNEPDVALIVFSADCTPILLSDPVTGAVGAVHSGWRGTAHGIVCCAVQAMEKEFGTNPADLRAVIGPCISKCCFETREDVPREMLACMGEQAQDAISRQGEKFHVDLKLLNRIWLARAGVVHIDVSDDCTCCQPERFWTHRKVGEQRGSLAAVIMRKGGGTP